MDRVIGYLKKNSIALKIICIHDLCIIIVSIVFYKLIPLLLNYPAFTYDNQFQWELEGARYSQQYLVIFLVTLITINIWILYELRHLNKLDCLLSGNQVNVNDIALVRLVCTRFPIRAYTIQSILPSVCILIIITLSTLNITAVTLKLWIIFFSFGTLAATFSFIFSKRTFTRILVKTHIDNDISNQKRFSLNLKIAIQLIPIFIVAILFTSLIGYSRLIREKGDTIFRAYDYQLSNILNGFKINNSDDLDKIADNIKLVNDKDEVFSISPSGELNVYNSKKPYLSKFFIKHLNEIALKSDGHVYDYYGVDVQGIAKEIAIDNQKWIIGVKYKVGSDETITFFIISFIVLFSINLIVILYFAKTLTDDISRVTMNLEEIARGVDKTFDKKLAVTSNDEIGELVIAFNKIQMLEKRSIDALKEQQAILVEQERLASLGQLIGGIAHNLRTPIMSISGAIEALKDLAYEYRDSIGDRSVTEQDHQEIAKEMLTWLEKMRPYCAYMSDVISAVKGQAVQMTASSTVKFTIDEVVKRVELLLRHELKRYHCVLNVHSQIDMKTEIKGEVNNLVQVFDNIIINAMQAYNGESGTIDLEIMRSGDNVEFIFRDYAKGIPQHIANRLFKEMITTKGKNGTGLGLYMSYSTIKGRFGGNMSFTTKEGVGTTFFISIPCITYGNEEAG